MVLANILEWQTAGSNYWPFGIYAATTDPAQQGCSVLAACFLLIPGSQSVSGGASLQEKKKKPKTQNKDPPLYGKRNTELVSLQWEQSIISWTC